MRLDEVIMLKDACELLHVSEKTLINLLADEDVPARKIGNKWLFSREALIRWIAEGKSTRYARNGQVNDEE